MEAKLLLSEGQLLPLAKKGQWGDVKDILDEIDKLDMMLTGGPVFQEQIVEFFELAVEKKQLDVIEKFLMVAIFFKNKKISGDNELLRLALKNSKYLPIVHFQLKDRFFIGKFSIKDLQSILHEIILRKLEKLEIDFRGLNLSKLPIDEFTKICDQLKEISIKTLDLSGEKFTDYQTEILLNLNIPKLKIDCLTNAKLAVKKAMWKTDYPDVYYADIATYLLPSNCNQLNRLFKLSIIPEEKEKINNFNDKLFSLLGKTLDTYLKAIPSRLESKIFLSTLFNKKTDCSLDQKKEAVEWLQNVLSDKIKQTDIKTIDFYKQIFNTGSLATDLHKVQKQSHIEAHKNSINSFIDFILIKKGVNVVKEIHQDDLLNTKKY